MTFHILGQDVKLISSETDIGRNTIAELFDQYYYLGSEVPNIMSAIFAWQEVANYYLSHEELCQIMTDNGFIGSY